MRAKVIARKGVLLNDPGFNTLSTAELTFEFLAIMREEVEARKERNKLIEEVFKIGFKALRHTLIELLGLHIGVQGLYGEVAEEERPEFVPFVYYVARPELLKHISEQAGQAQTAKSVSSDKALDQINDDLSKLSSEDLDSLFKGALSDDPKERWLSEENQEMLRSMGIELVKGDLNDE